MKSIRFFLISFLIISCNAPRAVYDFDQHVSFDQYSTYSLYPDLQSGLSQLDERRLISGLENQLEERGFSQSATPDLFINVYAEEFRENSRSSLGVGIGGGGGNVGVGVSGGIPLGGPETIMKLTFDFIDVAEDSLVWQAVVESKFDPNAKPEARQQTFNRMIKKALEGYPPKR